MGCSIVFLSGDQVGSGDASLRRVLGCHSDDPNEPLYTGENPLCGPDLVSTAGLNPTTANRPIRENDKICDGFVEITESLSDNYDISGLGPAMSAKWVTSDTFDRMSRSIQMESDGVAWFQVKYGGETIMNSAPGSDRWPGCHISDTCSATDPAVRVFDTTLRTETGALPKPPHPDDELALIRWRVEGALLNLGAIERQVGKEKLDSVDRIDYFGHTSSGLRFSSETYSRNPEIARSISLNMRSGSIIVIHGCRRQSGTFWRTEEFLRALGKPVTLFSHDRYAGPGQPFNWVEHKIETNDKGESVLQSRKLKGADKVIGTILPESYVEWWAGVQDPQYLRRILANKNGDFRVTSDVKKVLKRVYSQTGVSPF